MFPLNYWVVTRCLRSPWRGARHDHRAPSPDLGKHNNFSRPATASGLYRPRCGLDGQMSYRTFDMPGFAESRHTVSHWAEWMEDQGEIRIPVAPRNSQSCELCYGASGYFDGGQATWDKCQNCVVYNGAIDRLVPITYSIDAGLESMLHQYKDDSDSDWLRRPLGTLLYKFLKEHGDCIEQTAEGIDLATVVPANDQRRSFNHLEQLLRTVVGEPILGQFPWDLDVVARDRSVERPARGQLKPSAYRVTDPEAVDGAAVLLFDDTWTSGSSAASTAAALKAAGAVDVTVLTLGRQLNLSTNWGSTAAIWNASRARSWSSEECVLCA